MQFRLLVEYEGGAFAGWQVQPAQRTVQGELESALRTLLGEETRAHAAGRTDAGVHATGQVVCFRTGRELSPQVVCRALNALVGDDIAVRRVDIVGEQFDPRRSASSRTYEYRIWNQRMRSPFWARYSWHIARPLELAAMRAAASHLIGEQDFTSFRAAGCDAGTAVRRVEVSEWVETSSGVLVYRVTATAFLRHMVRNLVGTLAEVGRGSRRSAEMPSLIAARDRNLAGPTAPPHGLCLTRVDYPA